MPNFKGNYRRVVYHYPINPVQMKTVQQPIRLNAQSPTSSAPLDSPTYLGNMEMINSYLIENVIYRYKKRFTIEK